MLNVRIASPDEYERITAFYRETAYRPPIHPTDVLVIAEDADGICGALRLCTEEGVIVLRGMRVAADRQRQGIGTRLLEGAGGAISDQECYCIPHRRLRAFYSQAGFAEIPLGECPSFLRDRWRQYTEEYALDVILMRRPPVPASARPAPAGPI